MPGWGTGTVSARVFKHDPVQFTALGRVHAQVAQEVEEAMHDIFASGNWMHGKYTKLFEEWLQAGHERQFAVTTHSGTTALELVGRYLNKDGKRTILIPDLTYPATANAFLTTGWDVILCDVDEHGIIDVDQAPTNDFDWVCAVGLLGRPIPEYLGNLNLIEDGAQSWMSNGFKRVADYTTLSFDPTKNLPNYGNGGAVLTSDVDCAKFVLSYTHQGKEDRTFAMQGSNIRMSEFDAATLLIKANRLSAWQKRRRQIAEYWIDRLPEEMCMIKKEDLDTHGLQKFALLVEDSTQLMQDMVMDGVYCRLLYGRKPLHQMDAFKHLKGGGYVANQLSRHSLLLPFYPELTDDEVEFILDRILKNNPVAMPIHKNT